MSLRAAAQRPGPLSAAGHGRDGTGRTEPGAAAQLARDADWPVRGPASFARGFAPLVRGVDHLAGRRTGDFAPLARGADHSTTRLPDARVPTLAGTPVDASREGPRPAPCRGRPRRSPPRAGAPEASVQWSTADDGYGSARTARPWKDRPRPPRTDVPTTTEVSRTGNEPPPRGGADADRQGIRAAHHLPTGETP
ncbi:hypothetical protein [Streptomyces sp. 351MFTsu5.1]|uniref:hypothetical protein n=1 Tax=Streptomyces sp. 351MFTsu5.1 TaxID=1172180 RepID=UPI000363BC80|nr:hypothetical protein [Streptomyces sp. 351MFTsu5.1]